jgi:hypothetical protein
MRALLEARYDEQDGAAIWTRTDIADGEIKKVVEALTGGLSIRRAADTLGVDKGKVERAKKRPSSGDAEWLTRVARPLSLLSRSW